MREQHLTCAYSTVLKNKLEEEEMINLCPNYLHFLKKEKSERFGVWDAWSKGQKMTSYKKREKRRDELNEPFELHWQGKGKFPLGVYRVRCGGWVGLAGVRESKVCSESWYSNSPRICLCSRGQMIIIICFSTFCLKNKDFSFHYNG